MRQSCDILVIGAGMAGASAAFEMAETAAVILLEREDQPGYHSTGRSAALFSESYGPPQVRNLSAAGRAFFEGPPSGFADHPLLTPRGLLMLGKSGQEEALEESIADSLSRGVEMTLLDEGQARAMVPVLREGLVSCAAFEPGAMDIDVHALHQGYLRQFRQRGGQLACGAEVAGLRHADGVWEVALRDGRNFTAAKVVNAAGAWADEVAARAGLPGVGIAAKRRTAMIVDLPPGLEADRWPLTGDLDESYYFKPDAGKLLLSPADATPVPPQDVQPEELDVAIAVERVQQATSLRFGRIESRWAGLRSFAPDGVPVVGFAPRAEGFFWLAGQGGYGIQTAPAMARLAASLIRGEAVPADMRDLGVDAAALSPARF